VKDMRSEAEKKLVGTADEKVSHILPWSPYISDLILCDCYRAKRSSSLC
jgi:hypothetical protein